MRGRSQLQGRIHERQSHRRFSCSAGSRDLWRVEIELLHPSMHILKLICRTIIRLVKQAWILPQTVALAVRQRRQQVVLNELEAERLDRICNPSKYLGK